MLENALSPRAKGCALAASHVRALVVLAATDCLPRAMLQMSGLMSAFKSKTGQDYNPHDAQQTNMMSSLAHQVQHDWPRLCFVEPMASVMHLSV